MAILVPHEWHGYSKDGEQLMNCGGRVRGEKRRSAKLQAPFKNPHRSATAERLAHVLMGPIVAQLRDTPDALGSRLTTIPRVTARHTTARHCWGFNAR